MEEELKIAVSENFNLERAVCNHGFFMMAPNKWIPSQKSPIRPLNNNVTVSITQPLNSTSNYITVSLFNQQPILLSPEDRQSFKSQVSRMLRISPQDDLIVDQFHKLHPLAKKSGFARIIRSPTLFEDIVKSVLLCNCSWARSLDMAQGLCNLQYKFYGKKRGRGRKRKLSEELLMWGGNFPSPKEIACLDVPTLNKHCNLGYRAQVIHELAKSIQNGTLNLDDFETPITTHDSATSYRNRLLNIRGFGSFTVANIMMCMGFYQHIPIDTETIKHLKQVHGKTVPNRKKTQIDLTIAQIYDKYTPFQCLVYWMEHIEYYEKNLGKLSDLPHSKYRHVTSTNLLSRD